MVIAEKLGTWQAGQGRCLIPLALLYGQQCQKKYYRVINVLSVAQTKLTVNLEIIFPVFDFKYSVLFKFEYCTEGTRKNSNGKEFNSKVDLDKPRIPQQ